MGVMVHANHMAVCLRQISSSYRVSFFHFGILSDLQRAHWTRCLRVPLHGFCLLDVGVEKSGVLRIHIHWSMLTIVGLDDSILSRCLLSDVEAVALVHFLSASTVLPFLA
jgi:hypothetical protein